MGNQRTQGMRSNAGRALGVLRGTDLGGSPANQLEKRHVKKRIDDREKEEGCVPFEDSIVSAGK